MRRRAFVATVGAAGVSLLGPSLATAQADPESATGTPEGSDMETTAATTGYAPVNGLDMYYEIHGPESGKPLVLLHGAYGTASMFAGFAPTLAETRRVIVPEFQGNGHTADIDRPLRYESMADDVAALLEHLGIEEADIFGYSMGGGVALRLAIQHPELVRKLAVASASSTSDEAYPEVLAGIQSITP